MAAPSVTDINSWGHQEATATSLTVAHTAATGNSNIMAWATHASPFGDATGVTYGGTAMTKAVSSSGIQYYISHWYLANPATGAQNCVASYAAGLTRSQLSVITIKDAQQTSPIDVTGDTNGAGVTSLNLSITTNFNNSLIINSSMTSGGKHSSFDASETAQWTQGSAGVYEDFDGASEAVVTAGAVTLTTNNNAGAGTQETAAAIKAVVSSFTASTIRGLMGMGI